MKQLKPIKNKKKSTGNAISLFSNCGAGDVGYKLSGFDFKVMAEINPQRLEICGLNHPGAYLIQGDLNKTWKKVVDTYKDEFGDELDLLCACPPCQGFSSARGDRGKLNNPDHGMKDERNQLSLIIAKVAEKLNPKIIVVENVPAYIHRLVRDPRTNKPVTMANLLISKLQPFYDVYQIFANLSEYGIPQMRKRVFFTFIRKDLEITQKLRTKKLIPFPAPTHKDIEPITLHEALNSFNFPPLDAKSKETAKSDFGNGLHTVPVWDAKRYEMIATIPHNSGKSAWENSTCLICGETDIDENKAKCPSCESLLPRPIIKSKNGKYRLIKGFRTSSYKRMNPDLPSATITTASGQIGSHYTIHPNQNRVLSAFECAYLQTFPVEFNWGDALKKFGDTNVRAMIGEAVPPKFTKMHGDVLFDLLNNKIPENLQSSS